MNTTTELIGFSTFYNEEMRQSEYKDWTARDCEKERNALAYEGDEQGVAFMEALAKIKGMDITVSDPIALTYEIIEMHRQTVAACLGKI